MNKPLGNQHKKHNKKNTWWIKEFVNYRLTSKIQNANRNLNVLRKKKSVLVMGEDQSKK